MIFFPRFVRLGSSWGKGWCQEVSCIHGDRAAAGRCPNPEAMGCGEDGEHGKSSLTIFQIPPIKTSPESWLV